MLFVPTLIYPIKTVQKPKKLIAEYINSIP